MTDGEVFDMADDDRSHLPAHIRRAVVNPPTLTADFMPEWMKGPGGRFFNPDGTLKKVGGRPCVLTNDIALQFVRNMERCGKPYTSAMALGLKWETVRRWLDRGEQGEEPFATFKAAVDMAKGEWAMRQVDKIDKAADHKAAAWLLERHEGETWAKPQADTNINVGVALLPPQAENSQVVIDAEARVMQEEEPYEDPTEAAHELGTGDAEDY